MYWRSLFISLVLGLAIDYFLVWTYYWWIGEPFRWSGFWIWLAILFGAGLLLWLRKLLGFVVWYLAFGREALANEAFQKFVEFDFEQFDKQWDNVDDWLLQHVKEDRSAAASSLASAAAFTRQTGLWQYIMLVSAYKKAAIRYSSFAKRQAQKA